MLFTSKMKIFIDLFNSHDIHSLIPQNNFIHVVIILVLLMALCNFNILFLLKRTNC